MKFELRCSYDPAEMDIDSADQVCYGAVGRQSDFSGMRNGRRDHGWLLDDFDEAVFSRQLLESIGFRACISERVANGE